MATELVYLAWVALLTALLWLPYTMNMLTKHGLMAAVGNREKPLALAPWAERAKRAHGNAVENLVVFAAIVLVAGALNKFNATTAMAAIVYFWARLIHYVVYTAGWIWIRTAIWTVGWICCLVILYRILV